jgi:NAD-dependent DNA ligase
VYRWRQLLPFPVESNDEADQRLRYARRLIAENAVRFLKPGEEDEEGGGFGHAADEPTTRHRAHVKGEKRFEVTLELDADGRVRFANCTCAWHRREKLRKGPCAHILAASALASQQTVAPVTRDKTGTVATVRPDRFRNQTWVFTGALTRFTREQAESLIAQGGGKTAGSVSRNTSCVVAGEKAGSKLAKARDLNIPVLTEAEFEALIKEDR